MNENDGFVTLDSGKREEFPSGAKRDVREGKGRYDLIPAVAMARIAKLYERGAVKYGAWNFSKGILLSRYIDSMIRHAFNYLEGDRKEDHLAAVAWNAIAMIHHEEMIKRGILPPELDDIPRFIKEDK